MKTPPKHTILVNGKLINLDSIDLSKYDSESVLAESRPLSPEMRARWNRAKRGPGRPRVGAGVKVISLSIEGELLGKADREARRLKISRAQLVARGLRAVLPAKRKRAA